MSPVDIPQVGVLKGQKIYIKGMRLLKPAHSCPSCGQLAVSNMYYLEHGLRSFNCTDCGAKTLVK